MVAESPAMSFILALTLLAGATATPATAPAPKTLPRSSPEAQGLSSSAILAFLQAAEEKIDALHSFMLVRHGQVVAEGWWTPYGKADPHVMFSLSKSFTSTAVGLAIAEKKLSLDDAVLPAFPEDAPAEPSDNLKAMRVRDLLAMSTGHHTADLDKFSFTSEERLTKAFLGLPVAHKPGTHFLYNTPATYMLSAMVQKATGMTVLDYLGPRLFEPLGIENPTWEKSAQGVSLGGFGLSIKTEDIARFGQLYLQKGVWRGQRLLPAEWVEAATARQTSNGSSPTSDWDQGYGYQFWRCRHGLYRGDGAFGQFCIVMPEQDAVVAITSGTRDLQGVMNLVWDHILAGMKKTPLPPDAVAGPALKSKLASLSLRPQAGTPSARVASGVSGKTYLFPANDDKVEAVAAEFGAEGAVLVIRKGGQESRIPCGRGEWRKGSSFVVNEESQKVAASGAWTADDIFTAKLAAYETPFIATLALQFKGDELLLNSDTNVGFGQTKRPELVGRRTAAAD
jgi:CubicO group peptidase (beta-lactamase class C family)